MKRKLTHQFDEFFEITKQDDVFEGIVLGYFDGYAHIQINHLGHIVQAFIYKSKISNMCHIDNEDIKYFLPIDKVFDFAIESIEEERQTIGLSRKEYLKSFDPPNYGDVMNVSYVRGNQFKAYFYSNYYEGWMQPLSNNIPLGTNINVMLIIDAMEFA